MQIAIGWYEIPVVDFERARKFYEQIMDMELKVEAYGDAQMGFFKRDEGQVGGAIVHAEGLKPCVDGVTIYLDCGDDLQPCLERVVAAGGEVIIPKSLIAPDIGHFAQFIDSEGNRIALWSQN